MITCASLVSRIDCRRMRPVRHHPYQPKFAKLGEGSVQWLDALRVLRGRPFSDPFSVHTEYGMNAGEPALERIACEDAAYLRQLAASQGAD